MAKRIVTTTTIIDDLDGSPLEASEAESVTFELDGTRYEIDLSKQHAKSLRDSLKPYTKAARVVAARKGSSTGNRSNQVDLASAREWLRSKGHEVSSRGRIPNELMELYRSNS